MTLDESNLKRKMIRIIWRKMFFSKGEKLCISIHNSLNTKEQNEVKIKT